MPGRRMSDRVYVDFDDVLCETAMAFIPIVAERFGKQVQFNDIHSFDLSVSFQLEAAQVDLLMELMHDHDTLAAFVPIAGARETMQSWCDDGLSIEVVTGRPPSTYEVSLDWLERYKMPHDGLTIVDKYGRFDTDGSEVPTLDLAHLKTADFVAAVDDSPTMITFLSCETTIPLAIFDRPWNTAEAIPAGAEARVRRCLNWSDIDQFVRHHAACGTCRF